MLLLLCCFVGLLASAEGYQSCNAWGQCVDVNTADGFPCCEHIVRDEDCPRLAIVPRGWWNAKPPQSPSPMNDMGSGWDIDLLFTETDPCRDLLSCLKTVREMQKGDMDAGMSDIRYNSMISLDGRLFVGRGRDQAAGAPNNQKMAILGKRQNLCDRPDVMEMLQRIARSMNCDAARLRRLFPGVVIRQFVRDRNGNRVELKQPVTAAQLHEIWCE